MTPEDLLSVLSLEDLDDLAVRLEEERARAAGLPPAESARLLADLDILAAELEAQRANERRRKA